MFVDFSLDFSLEIEYGKSGEIIMAQYAYFTSLLSQNEQEVNFIKNNCFYIPFDNTTDNQVLLQKNPTIVRLRLNFNIFNRGLKIL